MPRVHMWHGLLLEECSVGRGDTGLQLIIPSTYTRSSSIFYWSLWCIACTRRWPRRCGRARGSRRACTRTRPWPCRARASEARFGGAHALMLARARAGGGGARQGGGFVPCGGFFGVRVQAPPAGAPVCGACRVLLDVGAHQMWLRGSLPCTSCARAPATAGSPPPHQPATASAMLHGGWRCACAAVGARECVRACVCGCVLAVWRF